MGAGGAWVSWAVGRGEQEARWVAPRRVCARRSTAQGSQSCSLRGNEKKSKAAQKAEGNPADEEQPLMGLSWQVYFLSNGHLFSMALCSLHTKGQMENQRPIMYSQAFARNAPESFLTSTVCLVFLKENECIALHQALPKERAAMQVMPWDFYHHFRSVVFRMAIPSLSFKKSLQRATGL